MGKLTGQRVVLGAHERGPALGRQRGEDNDDRQARPDGKRGGHGQEHRHDAFFEGNWSEYAAWRKARFGDDVEVPRRVVYRKLTR